MDNKLKVTVINDDRTLRAMDCKIQQVFSKEPDGPITHAAIYWMKDPLDDTTGSINIVPIENILYQRGDPFYLYGNKNIEPELVVTRIAISEKLRNDVFERDGNKCLKCGSISDLSVDHIIPFSRGGQTQYDNLQTLCMTCNRKKKASIID